MAVDTRLAIADSGGVLEQYVEDGCVSITQYTQSYASLQQSVCDGSGLGSLRVNSPF